MKQIMAEVIANVEVVANVFLMRLEAPEIALHGEPGQFIHLSAGNGTEPMLRRPISLHRIGKGGSDWSEYDRLGEQWRPRPGEISLLFAKVGKGTALLGRVRPGDRLSAVGPLGSGFKLEQKTRHVLLVAGGLGIAPLAALADEAIKREMTVTLLAGARNEASVMPATLLPPEIEYVVCTDDGSRGRPGVVTRMVPEFIDWADQVFACGPRPMLGALATLRLEGRLSTSKSVQVSLEEHMACGVGACLGCVVRTKKGLQRVCRDGPVFKLGDLEWT
jgi:dihydroorotate dehydrogenase electron transfer subunit